MDLSLADFLALPDEEKLPLIGDRAVLYARQFRRADLDRYALLADAAKGMPSFELGDATIEVDAQAQPASVLFRTRDGSPLLVTPCLHFARMAFTPRR